MTPTRLVISLVGAALTVREIERNVWPPRARPHRPNEPSTRPRRPPWRETVSCAAVPPRRCSPACWPRHLKSILIPSPPQHMCQLSSNRFSGSLSGSGDYQTDNHMNYARPLYAEIVSQASSAESEPEDHFDFPPTEYPGRELFTFSLFVLAVLSFLVWGSWKLISLAISLI